MQKTWGTGYKPAHHAPGTEALPFETNENAPSGDEAFPLEGERRKEKKLNAANVTARIKWEGETLLQRRRTLIRGRTNGAATTMMPADGHLSGREDDDCE